MLILKERQLFILTYFRIPFQTSCQRSLGWERTTPSHNLIGFSLFLVNNTNYILCDYN